MARRLSKKHAEFNFQFSTDILLGIAQSSQQTRDNFLQVVCISWRKFKLKRSSRDLKLWLGARARRTSREGGDFTETKAGQNRYGHSFPPTFSRCGCTKTSSTIGSRFRDSSVPPDTGLLAHRPAHRTGRRHRPRGPRGASR